MGVVIHVLCAVLHLKLIDLYLYMERLPWHTAMVVCTYSWWIVTKKYIQVVCNIHHSPTMELHRLSISFLREDMDRLLHVANAMPAEALENISSNYNIGPVLLHCSNPRSTGCRPSNQFGVYLSSGHLQPLRRLSQHDTSSIRIMVAPTNPGNCKRACWFNNGSSFVCGELRSSSYTTVQTQ